MQLVIYPYFTSYSNKCYTQVHAACWYRKKYVFKMKKKQPNEQKNIYMYIHIINFIKCSVISTLFIILFNKDNYFFTTCRTFEVIKLFLHLIYYLLDSSSTMVIKKIKELIIVHLLLLLLDQR